jgi:hypothetical protein
MVCICRGRLDEHLEGVLCMLDDVELSAKLPMRILSGEIE